MFPDQAMEAGASSGLFSILGILAGLFCLAAFLVFVAVAIWLVYKMFFGPRKLATLAAGEISKAVTGINPFDGLDADEMTRIKNLIWRHKEAKQTEADLATLADVVTSTPTPATPAAETARRRAAASN